MKITIPSFFHLIELNKILKEKEEWLYSNLKNFSENKKHLCKSRDDYIKNKEKARGVITDRVCFYSGRYGLNYNRIFIKDHKTRWGSCSSKKNLNFNYKLIFLSEKLLDYVVVHEVCHLKEMNHSRSFWNLVSLTFPNYKGLEGELKKNNFFNYD
ncbi:M48 family metallopeptidase [bacterium]|nr:M48 family metallopeptidase [bacterium]